MTFGSAFSGATSLLNPYRRVLGRHCKLNVCLQSYLNLWGLCLILNSLELSTNALEFGSR